MRLTTHIRTVDGKKEYYHITNEERDYKSAKNYIFNYLNSCAKKQEIVYIINFEQERFLWLLFYKLATGVPYFDIQESGFFGVIGSRDGNFIYNYGRNTFSSKKSMNSKDKERRAKLRQVVVKALSYDPKKFTYLDNIKILASYFIRDITADQNFIKCYEMVYNQDEKDYLIVTKEKLLEVANKFTRYTITAKEVEERKSIFNEKEDMKKRYENNKDYKRKINTCDADSGKSRKVNKCEELLSEDEINEDETRDYDFEPDYSNECIDDSVNETRDYSNECVGVKRGADRNHRGMLICYLTDEIIIRTNELDH